MSYQPSSSRGTPHGSSNRTSATSRPPPPQYPRTGNYTSTPQIPPPAYTRTPPPFRPTQARSSSQKPVTGASASTGAAANSQLGNASTSANGGKEEKSGSAWMRMAIKLGGHGEQSPSV
ncbi:hypothetical protein O1611_g2511 [Lasiodiplodia mahajangana]|uniref:Uncharacterized protein n=1 Tax=Lasiodiplodia mahajangana TaxID=1108764 RepID=A0ACC2JUA7_9PEZI|nr:hypothetical protein O1611_g2511 [Lasiodiplodia mahajangana]